MSRQNDVIILRNKKITTQILEIIGDIDSKKILDILMSKSLTSFEILDKIESPQATVYRKIKALVNVGLLVEIEKIQGKSGPPSIKLGTIYNKLDVSIVKNSITVKLTITKIMMNKCTFKS